MEGYDNLQKVLAYTGRGCTSEGRNFSHRPLEAVAQDDSAEQLSHREAQSEVCHSFVILVEDQRNFSTFNATCRLVGTLSPTGRLGV